MQAVQDIFKKLGGVEPIAIGLGENADTVLRWRLRGRIPEDKIVGIVGLLKDKGEDVDATDILSLNRPMLKRGWPAGKKRKKARRARA